MGDSERFDVDDGDGIRPAVGFPGIVPVLGGRSLPITHVGPDLGEHTRDVLAELGWPDDRIDAYEEALR